MGLISDDLQSLRRLENFVGAEKKKQMHRCIIISLVATIVIYTIPFICGLFLDSLVKVGETGVLDLGLLIDLASAIAVLIIFWYVATSNSSHRMSKIALESGRDIRIALNRKMMRVPIGYVDSTPAGELTSRFTTDLPAVNKMISTDYIGLIVHSTMIVAIIIMMLFTSYQLALLYLLLLPITLFISRNLATKSEVDIKEQRIRESKLNTQMSRIISSHRTIKAESLEKDVELEFGVNNDGFTEAYVTAQKRSSFIAPLVSINVNTGYLITVLIGAIMLLGGHIHVGMLLSFMIYVRMVNKPLLKTATVFDSVREEMISLQRIMDILEAPEEEPIPESGQVEVHGSVTLENVTFSYNEGEEILHDVSFEARSGEITALVGKTASGKTTVANLIMGFYRPDSGTIRIGGVDVGNIPRSSFSKGVAAVLQDPWVFDGTIRENIVYNRENISDERLQWVAKITGLDDYVQNLPDKYDTVIGNDKNRLPMAQKRMVAMARAFAGDPKIIILDEAVAGLDPIAGSSVMTNINNFIEGRTVILITHNEALIDQADRVVRLDKGRVVSNE